MAEPGKAGTPQKSTTVTLKSPDGAQLKVQAKVDKKTGTAASWITHSTAKNGDGKRTHTRGATTQHKTLDEAVTAMQALAVTAVKQGWLRPAAPVMGKKPDAFDAAHLPAPKPALKK